MIIGIDASRAFDQKRTGIEEYSFQVIKHLIEELRNSQVVLYVRKRQVPDLEFQSVLPGNWRVKEIGWPYFWTQLGLSLEMLLNPVDVLFIPAHTVPLIHAKKTVVTVHGLEYEFIPEGYSWWERMYMRWSIKFSCRWASRVIAVSENTKQDLIRLYRVSEDKIAIVPEGYSYQSKDKASEIENDITEFKNYGSCLLFIGRIEKRKNIEGIVKAFEILKEKHKPLHKLVLAGKPGYGYQKIKNQILNSKYSADIVEIGFVSDKTKQKLLQHANVFLFPSFYEGFGLPILEAQNAGLPVITSKISSMPEVAGEGAILVDPQNFQEISEAILRLIKDEKLRNAIITKGQENSARFSWPKCAKNVAQLIINRADK